MRTTTHTHVCDFCGRAHVGGDKEPPFAWARLSIPLTNGQRADETGGPETYDACEECLAGARQSFIALATAPSVFLKDDLDFVKESLTEETV